MLHTGLALLHVALIHSVTGIELAAVDVLGSGQQHLHRSSAELVEQPDAGMHAWPSMLFDHVGSQLVSNTQSTDLSSTCILWQSVVSLLSRLPQETYAAVLEAESRCLVMF